MKVPKEYVFFLILGLFALAYVFDAIVNPLELALKSPYQYIQFMGVYPFTTVSVILKAAALFLSPLWILSFIEKQYMPKAVFLFILGSVGQLYAVQDVATQAEVIPLEWTLALAFACVLLLFPAALFFIQGLFIGFRQNLNSAKVEAALERKKKEHATDSKEE